MGLFAPPQGVVATSIGDRITIDGVDLDFPAAIGSNNQVLTITDAPNGTLNWQTPTAGAPDGAQYLTRALDGGLSAERVFTPSTGLTAVDGGANGTYALTNDVSTGVAGGQTINGGTAESENLTIDSTTNGTKGDIVMASGGGSVLIGTATPVAGITFVIQKGGDIFSAASIRNPDAGAAAGASLEIRANGASMTAVVRSTTFSGTIAGLELKDSVELRSGTGGNTASRFIFGTGGVTPLHIITSSAVAMTIDTSQQVGIGIQVPLAILHVRENQNAASQFFFDNPSTGTAARASVQISADSSNIIATAYSDAATANVFGIAAIGSTALLATKPSGSGATNLFLGSIATAGLAGDIIFGTTNIVRMRVLAAGGILISNDLELDGALNHDGSTAGFFGTGPVSKATALTAEDATVIDATYGSVEEAVLNNLRTRVGELESKLQAYGLLT